MGVWLRKIQLLVTVRCRVGACRRQLCSKLLAAAMYCDDVASVPFTVISKEVCSNRKKPVRMQLVRAPRLSVEINAFVVQC